MTDQPPIAERHPNVQQLNRYFDYQHLPPHLQTVSRHFAITADALLRILPDSAELTAALRKLLESKDCAVRAALELPADFREEDG